MFTVDVAKRTGVPLTPNVRLVADHPWSMRAGLIPEAAQITAFGDPLALWGLCNWLRYEVVIRNEAYTPCWWGYVNGVSITIGGLTVELSLDDMANSIAVKYSYALNGRQVSGQTSWAQDAFSVATYGIKEHIESAGDTTPGAAATLQATLLAAKAYPVSAPPAIGDPQPASATLFCRGKLNTLDWRYYSQPLGKIVSTAGGANQVLGWGFAAPLGFKAAGKKIHQIDAKFAGLPSGARVQISGLAANNGAFTVVTATTQAAQSYVSASISFNTIDDIMDSSNGLGFVRSAEMIQISGSAANSRYHLVSSAGAGHVTTDTTWNGTISNEVAGPSITVKEGSSIIVAETLTNAVPSATATVVAHGQAIGQAIVPSLGGWTVGEIQIRVKTVGSPADGVKVELRSDAAGAPSGTILDSATVAAGSISDQLDWITFALANTVALSAGVTYWIVVERTGANSNTDYYVVDVDEQLGYGAGALLLWTGAAWVSRATNADLAFQVWGHRETTAQMQDIATAVGQFGLSVAIVTASGQHTRQYRDGTYTGLSEFEALLNLGTAGGQRLLAALWPATSGVRIYAEPDPDPLRNLLLRSDGRFYWPSGAPLEAGLLPVGQWVTLADVPNEANSAAMISPVFIQAAEFDPKSGRIRPTETRGGRSVWRVGGVGNG